MSRMEEIEARAKSLPLRPAGTRYVWGERVPWATTADANVVHDLITTDIPWLLAEVRRVQEDADFWQDNW